MAKVFATTVFILAELRNNCRHTEDDRGGEEMAPNIAFVDIFHLFTDFTVEAFVARKAEARISADSVFAAPIVCTRNGLACVTVWGEKKKNTYPPPTFLIKYLFCSYF